MTCLNYRGSRMSKEENTRSTDQMKSMSRVLMCLISMCVLEFSAVSGKAAEVFFDSKGFEDYAVGAIEGQRQWHELAGGKPHVLVQGATVHGGKRAIQIVRNESGYAGCIIKVDAASRFVWDLWVYAYRREGGMSLQVFNSAHNKIYSAVEFNNGIIYARRRPTPVEVDSLKKAGRDVYPISVEVRKYVEGEWIHVVIEHDCLKSEYRVKIDGEESGLELPFFHEYDQDDRFDVQMSTHGGPEGEPVVVIDDMVIREP